MYIKDLEGLTKMHFCPKCYYIPPTSQHGNYNKERFEKHVEKCDGVNGTASKLHKELSLDDVAVPYIPHIQKNKTFVYLFAHNRLNEYQYIRNYITYDFETVSKKVDKKYGTKSYCSANLYPVSVAYTIKINDQATTKSMYIAKMSYFEFIYSWLDAVFVDADQICKDRVAYINELNLPKNIKDEI
jgi:hypothetical protein